MALRWSSSPSTHWTTRRRSRPCSPGLDTQSTTWSSWCGVNRPLARDITCRTHDSTAGSSGIDYILTQYSVGRASYGTIHTFGFGHLDNAKYPLVETRTTGPGYPVLVTERFRGWDTRKYSGTWKMSPVSGTGY